MDPMPFRDDVFFKCDPHAFHPSYFPIRLDQLPQKNDGSQWVTPITIDQLHSNIKRLAYSQQGGQLLEDFLLGDDEQIHTLIFEELEHHLEKVMLHQFGNNVFQSVLRTISSRQMARLIKMLKPYIVRIACNQFGTRCIQRLIEYAHTPSQRCDIIDMFTGPQQLCELMLDPFGISVITKILEQMSSDDSSFVVGVICNNSQLLSNDPYGTIVLNKCRSLGHLAHQIPQELRKAEMKFVAMDDDEINLVKMHDVCPFLELIDIWGDSVLPVIMIHIIHENPDETGLSSRIPIGII